MALTELQRRICRLIAENRIASGESYLAGPAALNALILAPRISRDIDLFHDPEEALGASWQADRTLLQVHGLSVRLLRERPSFVEALVSEASEDVLVQWVRDSAYRFFPLVQHEELGLVLHPFDLATNKVLALGGPPAEAGKCVLTVQGSLCHQGAAGLSGSRRARRDRLPRGPHSRSPPSRCRFHVRTEVASRILGSAACWSRFGV